MTFAPQTVYKTSYTLLPELRDLFHGRPFLAHYGPETVSEALRAYRGVEAEPVAVEAAMEVLLIDGELLS
jgi:hypothetical protein